MVVMITFLKAYASEISEDILLVFSRPMQFGKLYFVLVHFKIMCSTTNKFSKKLKQTAKKMYLKSLHYDHDDHILI